MSKGIEENVIGAIKKSDMFTIQVDESTDISNRAQLLVFVRFIHNEKIVMNFCAVGNFKKPLQVKIYLTQ